MLEKPEAKPSHAQEALLCHWQGARGTWDVSCREGSHRQAHGLSREGTCFISGLDSCQTLGENPVKEVRWLSAAHVPAKLSLSNQFLGIYTDLSIKATAV